MSIDDYSTGKKTNHIKNKRVKYINNQTKNISKILEVKKKKYQRHYFTLENLREFIRVF